jgi:hypothetical protein
MPTYVLPLGVITTLLAGVIYALPAKRCLLFCSAGAPALTMSNDPAMAVTTAVVLTNGQMEVAGGFIKATADTPVVVKPF